MGKKLIADQSFWHATSPTDLPTVGSLIIQVINQAPQTVTDLGEILSMIIFLPAVKQDVHLARRDNYMINLSYISYRLVDLWTWPNKKCQKLPVKKIND